MKKSIQSNSDNNPYNLETGAIFDSSSGWE